MTYKIYKENSTEISNLDSTFQTIINHFITFLDEWIASNTSYSYEIISTGRSWYNQKQVTTIAEDKQNGLSWYLYGKAISINIYTKTSDQLSTTYDSSDYTKNTINFTDGSAKTFIVAAQTWFKSNLLNGNIVKIYGVYPDIATTLTMTSAELTAAHLNDEYTIYWGGLFSGYSNFTHFEWHPGYLTTEIYKIRNNYLNTCYNGYDILTNISSEIPSSSIQYLDDTIEMIEEDYLSVWKLKNEISLNKSYNLIDVFTWALSNTHTLSQAIIYYTLIGDYNNKTFFQYIQDEISSITVTNTDGIYTLNSSNFTLTYDETSEFTITYYNEFEEEITLNSTDTYVLPYDDPTEAIDQDFDLSVLEDSSSDTDTLTNISTNMILSELSSANQYVNPSFNINEHGMIGDLSINVGKLVTSIDDAQSTVNGALIFEEMITPPNQKDTTRHRGVLDISQIVKNIKASDYSEEMIVPPNS